MTITAMSSIVEPITSFKATLKAAHKLLRLCGLAARVLNQVTYLSEFSTLMPDSPVGVLRSSASSARIEVFCSHCLVGYSAHVNF